MHKYLKRYIYWIFSFFLIIGIVFEFLQLKLVPTKKHYKIEHFESNETEVLDYLEYSPKYIWYSTLSTLSLGIGVSLLILILFDKKIDEINNDLNEKVRKKEREAFEQRIIELQNKIQSDVFEGTLQKIIPKEIFFLLKSEIFLNDFVRKNTKWAYEIALINNKITVRQTVIYDLINLKDNDATEQFSIWTSKTKNQEIVVESIRINDIEISCNPDTTIESRIEEDNYNYSVTLSKGESKKVMICINNVYEGDYVRDLQLTKYPMINLDLQVSKTPDLNVVIDGTFAQPLTLQNDLNDKLLFYNNVPAVLPGQGVIYIVEKTKQDT